MFTQRVSCSDKTSEEEAKQNFLERTIKVWQPHTLRQLTVEDARQIAENIVGFIEILKEWNQDEQTKIYS